jgi:hypothetical protein
MGVGARNGLCSGVIGDGEFVHIEDSGRER